MRSLPFRLRKRNLRRLLPALQLPQIAPPLASLFPPAGRQTFSPVFHNTGVKNSFFFPLFLSSLFFLPALVLISSFPRESKKQLSLFHPAAQIVRFEPFFSPPLLPVRLVTASSFSPPALGKQKYGASSFFGYQSTISSVHGWLPLIFFLSLHPGVPFLPSALRDR